MLSDTRKMDQINPFAKDGPGAWSAPYDFAPSTPLKEGPSMWDSVADVSPMCLADISAGGICENPIANCPMSRALEPTREIEPDADEAGSLDSLYGTKLIPKEKLPVLVPRYGGHSSTRMSSSSWLVILVFILIALLVLARR